MPNRTAVAYRPKIHGEPAHYIERLLASVNTVAGDGTYPEAVRMIAAYSIWRRTHEPFDMSTLDDLIGNAPFTNSDEVVDHYTELLAQELEQEVDA